MNNMTITNNQGGNNTAVVELSQGHLFMCKDCNVETNSPVEEFSDDYTVVHYNLYEYTDPHLEAST